MNGSTNRLSTSSGRADFVKLLAEHDTSRTAMHGQDVELAVAVAVVARLRLLAQLAPDSCESLPDVGLHARRVAKAWIKNRLHAVSLALRHCACVTVYSECFAVLQRPAHGDDVPDGGDRGIELDEQILEVSAGQRDALGARHHAMHQVEPEGEKLLVDRQKLGTLWPGGRVCRVD